ncbi:hypothetical protein ACFLVC_04950 [Chloroflexota bacterium]
MGFPEHTKERAVELYQGRSATKALKLLKEELLQEKTPEGNSRYTEQDMPDERSIRRWHNKKLLEEHFEQMAGVAVSLICGVGEVISGFGEVRKRLLSGDKNDIYEYFHYADGTDGLGVGVTRERLGSKLAVHIETVMEQCPDLDWKSFLPHIIAEYPEGERMGLVLVAKANPYELLQALKRMATEKSFEGKCPTCHHLHQVNNTEISVIHFLDIYSCMRV